MAKNFKLDLAGLNELMKSPEMQNHLSTAGQAVASAAGVDYDHQGYVINYVAIENIFPTSEEAAHESYENNSLLKALGSVGLQMSK